MENEKLRTKRKEQRGKNKKRKKYMSPASLEETINTLRA